MQLRRPNAQDERDGVDVWIGLDEDEARYLYDGNGGNLFPRLAALNALTERLLQFFGWGDDGQRTGWRRSNRGSRTL